MLLREPNRLYNAPFPQTPTFPIPIRANRADNIEGFHPDIEVASARTFMVSLQRAITRSTAVEVRYVGTLGVNQWSEINYNERNIVENGFLDEFKLAMANLQANNAAGGNRLGSFAYFGAGSGTNPLPIYLAYLNGSRDAGNPAAYTGGANTWTNSTLAGRLVRTNPAPNHVSRHQRSRPERHYAAADLDGNLTRRNNALAAGYPANFFVVNPHANQVNINDSGAFSSYHAIQAEVRRRLSRGLQVNASYQYALEEGLGLSRLPLRPRQQPDQRLGPPRDQDAVGLDAAGRSRRAIRQRHPSAVERHHRRMAVQRRRPHPGSNRGLRQRAAGRHDQSGRPEDVQVGRAHRSSHGTAHRLHHARRCNPEHAPRLQHELDVTHRVQRPRRARGTLLRAAEQRRLHPGQGR